MKSNEPNPIALPCPAEKLLVHQPPMLLIRELTARDNHSASALASISDATICNSPKRGILPEYFIEIIAQTVAAAYGFDTIINGIPPREGYIVGIDKFTLKNLPDSCCELQIHIKLELDLGSVKVMKGDVSSDLEHIASAELKVWEHNN